MHTNTSRKTIKSGLVAIIGLYFLLVFVGNLVDYGSNYAFVQHVLSMDTIFPDSTLVSRAITSSTMHTIAYRGIIITEGIVAVLCLRGAISMYRKRNNDTTYKQAKILAYWGLFVGFGLFTLGFMTIGGEWFAMWQSDTWNGLSAAHRNMTMIGIVLLALASSDEG